MLYRFPLNEQKISSNLRYGVGVKILFGLGNPGIEYENTYHNAGSLLAEYLEGKIGIKVIDMAHDRLMPVFMNESGIAIKKHIRKMGAKPEEILVLHDDSDIELGKYKYSYGIGSAGHRGIQSIIDVLGTKDFHRIRIGIRKKPGKALDFVLKKMHKGDKETLNKLFGEIETSISSLVS